MSMWRRPGAVRPLIEHGPAASAPSAPSAESVSED
jgi:hypothetical protein